MDTRFLSLSITFALSAALAAQAPTKRDALRILAEQLLMPSASDDYASAVMDGTPLVAETVTAADGDPPSIAVGGQFANPQWFAQVNFLPDAMWGHDVTYVFIDTVTGAVTTFAAEDWAEIDGVALGERNGGDRIEIFSLTSRPQVTPGKQQTAEPVGDYGDAPDGALAYPAVLGRFPTFFATGNSLLSRPGAHTLAPGIEVLGSDVTPEQDADDRFDPDGIPNHVDADSDERMFVAIDLSVSPTPTAWLLFDVSVASGGPAVTRYVNALFDFDRSGHWAAPGAGTEWGIVNYPVAVTPGTLATFASPPFSWFGSLPDDPEDLWIRVALTRATIDPATFPGVGWDGSGAFAFGEIEDFCGFPSLNTPGDGDDDGGGGGDDPPKKPGPQMGWRGPIGYHCLVVVGRDHGNETLVENTGKNMTKFFKKQGYAPTVLDANDGTAANDPSAASITAWFDTLLANVKCEDKVMIFFIAHGKKSSPAMRLASSLYTLPELQAQLNRVMSCPLLDCELAGRCCDVTVIIESCYSGQWQTGLQMGGRRIVTTSQADRESWGSHRNGGYYSQAYAAAASDPSADNNPKDGKISPDEAHAKAAMDARLAGKNQIPNHSSMVCPCVCPIPPFYLFFPPVLFPPIQPVAIPGPVLIGPPFGSPVPERWHWVLPHGDFQAQLAAGPMIIQQLDLRIDEAVPMWPNLVVPDVEIRMGAAANNPPAYGPTFDENFAATPSDFFAGDVQLPAGSNSPSSAPQWTVSIPAQEPLVYDSSRNEDLIIDVTKFGGGQLPPLDGGQNAGFRAGNQNPLDPFWNPLLLPFPQEQWLPVCRLCVFPLVHLFPDFAADVHEGPAPLGVPFRDRSAGGSGPKSFQWDFGDGSPVSTLQNPTHVYTAPGEYEVRLTVTDSSGTASETKVDFIRVDPRPVADFVPAGPTIGTAPFSVGFFDLSQHATCWFWDLDGDAIIDSTAQNPSFNYTEPGRYTVSLHVKNPSGTSDHVEVDLVVAIGPTVNTLSPPILQYQFNEPRGSRTYNSASTTEAPEFGQVSSSSWQKGPGRNLFDANEPNFGCIGTAPGSTAPPPWIDTGWRVRAQGSFTIMWWQRMHTAPGPNFAYFFGVDNPAALRCYTGGDLGTSIGFLLPPVGIVSAGSVQAAPNVWQHVALVVDDVLGVAQWYVDGNPDPAPQFFPPGSVNFLLPETLNLFRFIDPLESATSFFDIDDFRIYDSVRTGPQLVADLGSEVATQTPYDTELFFGSCFGPTGIPEIGAIGVPQIGTNFTITLENLEPGRPVSMFLGYRTVVGSGIPLPFDLSLLVGGPPCPLATGIDVFQPVPLANPLGSASLPLNIPPGSMLAGLHLHTQAVLLGSGNLGSSTVVVSPPMDSGIQN